MNIAGRRRQSGQLLPIAAVGFIVVAAIAGLAIDTSRDYLIKRDAQNAADFAALAAAKQMTLSGNLSVAIAPGSAAVRAAHDFASNNGFNTIYNSGCDSTTGGFTTTWFDVSGLPCNATSGFNFKVSINEPVVALQGAPVPTVCQGPGKFSCVQVVITASVAQLFASVIGVNRAFVTVGGSAYATLPGSSTDAPPPNTLVLYQPQSGCNPATQQCFDATKPVGRSQMSCTGGTNNCPTFWTNPNTNPAIYGYDGNYFTPASDLPVVVSNGDMVIQSRTTLCDPFNGGTCAKNAVKGPKGFALASGASVHCSQFGGGASAITPCTTNKQPGPNEIDANQTPYSTPTYWRPTVDTSKLSGCGSLVLNGQKVYGPCANAQEPFLIEPGVYSSIVINHGTYEFDQGLYDITGTAPVNTATGAGYWANGIDHSQETSADFDLCTGGGATACPNLTAGIWFGHGGGAFSAYVTPTSGSCSGGAQGASGGGGDSTIISANAVVFRFESGSGGFVSTHEVAGLTMAGPGVNSLASVNGAPLLIDEENNSFIHIDAASSNNNQVQGVIYQTSSATGGGVEINLGMAGSSGTAMTGEVLAYTFTVFGTTGKLDFQNGYGAGTVSGIQTSGKNETSIISSVTLQAAQPGYQTLTVNYFDEFAMDAYDQFIKINNGAPIFFSQGVWAGTPPAGAPLPPPSNNPGDAYPSYPTSGQAGNYVVKSMNPPDWTYSIPNSNGSTIELNGNWMWGHEWDITGWNGWGANFVTVKYTFPVPAGSYVAVAVFVSDGDHCGDYAYASQVFKNTGGPGPGQQTIGGVSLIQ
jgi:hypothetical protein